MEKYNLGALERVDLREVWNHEALDFTGWLQAWGEKFQRVFGEYIRTLDTY